VNISNIKLADGNEIPRIGLGLWKVKDQAEFNTAFKAAIEAGYRHFDTAQAYDNEHFLGEALKRSSLKRREVYITTKIKISNFSQRHLQKSFEQSLKDLQTDYVDLLLLHFPVTVMRKKAWLALEEIQRGGEARSIGVSNYTVRHLEDMKKYASVVPAVNQVELHVFLQQPQLIQYCKGYNIAVEAYSPLAHAASMDDETIQSIAAKHGKSYAQIMLRWLFEQELVILPKSVTPSRIRENIDILDFELDDEDRRLIAGLDRDLRTCWSPVHVP
jgi:methylglyoxal/glyoxal reductase